MLLLSNVSPSGNVSTVNSSCDYAVLVRVGLYRSCELGVLADIYVF